MDYIDMKIKEYDELLKQKTELENTLKSVKAELDECEQAICDAMEQEEKPCSVVNGYNYSLQVRDIYSKRSDEDLCNEGIDFFQVLRDEGLGDIIKTTVDQRTLTASINNYIEENGELPEQLRNSLNLYTKRSISKRKANVSALEKAKKGR